MTVAAFDGVNLPGLQVLLGFGAGLTPAPPDVLRLGGTVGLGTARLGGIQMTDVAADVDGLSVKLGGLGDVGVADGTASITVDNTSGDFDPENLAGRYVTPSALNAQDSRFAAAGVGNWRAGTACTLTRTPTAGYGGLGALAITCTGAANPWLLDDANAGAGAIVVTPGQPWSLATHVLSTTGRPWRLVHRWLNGTTYVTQTNGPYVTTAAGTWTEVRAEGAVVPGGVNRLVLQMEMLATPAAGEVHVADNFRAVQGTTAGRSLVDLDVPVSIRLLWGGAAYVWFTGVLDSIVPNDQPPKPTVTLGCIDPVGVLGRRKPLPETPPQWDGDLSGTRIGRLLDAGGHSTSAREIAAGRTLLPATTLGQSVRKLLDDVVATEFGLLWANNEGRIVFYDRRSAAVAPRSTTVQLTVTDDDLMEGLERAMDRERFSNVVQVTRSAIPSLPGAEGPADDPQTMEGRDTASVDRYGEVLYAETVGTLLRSDDDSLAMAQWLAPQFAVPSTLIRQLTVDPLHRPGVDWPALLGLRLLDRIRAVRDGHSGGPVDKQLLVKGLGLTMERDPPRLEVALDTSTPPAPPSPNRLRLGGTVGLGTAELSY